MTFLEDLGAGDHHIDIAARFLGRRIDMQALKGEEVLAHAPLAMAVGAGGVAVVFRYGVVTLFHTTQAEETAFLRRLETFVSHPFREPENERATLRIHASVREQAYDGQISLQRAGIEHLQLVADILAKSVVLAHYEVAIASAFDSIEPLSAELEKSGRVKQRGQELLRHIGRSLLVQTTMVARVEVTEKPELLWEHPTLDMLYARLEDEYELSERHRALGRKLELVSRTAETLLEYLQHSHSLRVEWYIVVLIVIEIILSLFSITGSHTLQ